MKHPKLNDLLIDKTGTRYLRGQMAKTQKIKITINLDSDILSSIRQISAKNGIPYQNLLNRLLRETLAKKKNEQSRMQKLEKEIAAIKKKLVA